MKKFLAAREIQFRMERVLKDIDISMKDAKLNELQCYGKLLDGTVLIREILALNQQDITKNLEEVVL